MNGYTEDNLVQKTTADYLHDTLGRDESIYAMQETFGAGGTLGRTDVPSLSTLYLDKPLKAHTLMQAIARASRVNEGKNNGLIVDYCGILLTAKGVRLFENLSEK